MAGVWRDLIGTVYSTLRIGLNKSTLDASGITAPRTHVLPDESGTLALTSQLGGGSVYVREVDFGSPGAVEKFFTVTITGATTGQRVIATPSLDMPAGVDEDELEMDPLVCAARVSATNTVRLLVASPAGGRISGKRNINITIGA